MDALANFAYGVVATAPSPATSGTSLVLQTGQGASFPAAPFDVTMWPASVIPLNSNAEIARCTVISGDTLTITRAQYGTTAQPVAIGFQVCQSIDVNLINQLAIRLVPRAAGPVTAATYTVPANELTPFDTTSNSITATLPTAPPDGTVVGLKIVTLGAGHSVTFNCAGSDVFNKTGGATSGTLSLLGQAVYMQYKASGAIWYVVGDDIPLSQIDARYVQQSTGAALTLNGTPSIGQIPVATGAAAATWQTPTPVPLPGAVNLQGHSYLAVVDRSIPEPMTQGRYTASRIAGMLGAPNDSVISMTKATGYLMLADGPSGSSWGTVLQRLIPPSGAGLTAQYAQGSGEAYTMPGQVNPPLPAVGQPTMVSLIGLNETALVYGGGLIPFTASLNGVGGVMTSATNLSSSGSYAPGRSGGNGIQVGDFISGAGIRAQAQVASVTQNASATITAATNVSTTVTCTASGTYVVGELVTISGAAGGTWSSLNGTWAVTVGGTGSFQVVVSVAPTGSYTGSSATIAANTLITFSNTAQILSAQTSVSYNVMFGANSGSSNFAGQGVTACVNAWMATIARHVAGAIVRSDDAALTYGGTWTTVPQTSGNSGPSIAQTTVNGSSVTYTFPATHPGGMVSIIGVGTTDLDTSGCSITLSGTSAAGVLNTNTTVARAGWAGIPAPVVVRIKTTAADAGKTLIITFNSGSGGTNDIHQYQFDSLNFDAPYQSPFILVTQPNGCIGSAGTPTNPTIIAALNGAMTTVQSNFQAVPSGGFPSIGNITPTYTNIVIDDFATIISKRSFYLGSTITTGTTTGITLIGQRSVAQGDQQAPYVGQQLGIPTANVGDQSEVALVTSVTPAANSGPGSAYPAWTVNLTRNAVTGIGNIQAVAATGSTSSLISPLFDVMWMAPDYLHPGDVGSALIASSVLSTFLAVPNTANPDFVAASSQRWTQGRTQPYPRAVDGGSWQPRGTTGTLVMAANTAYALRYYASEWQVVTQLGLVPTTNATSRLYSAILSDVSYGSYPGLPITDFGLSGVAVASNLNTAVGPTGDQLLAPGWYWVVVAINSPVTPITVRSISTRFDDPAIDAPVATGPELGATGGIIGYSGTCQGTAGGASNNSSTITNILPTAWTPIFAGTQIPRPFMIRNVQRYSTAL